MKRLAFALLLLPSLSHAQYHSTVQGQIPTPEEGASETTLTAHDLAALPGAVDREVTDGLRVVPGVTADALGQNHIRGNYADVRTWLDGVPLPVGLSNQLLPLVPTEVLSKVELIIGGLPAEFDGVVGVLQLNTNLAQAGQQGWAKLTYGTYNTVRPSVGYTATFGRVSVLVSGSYLQSDRGLDSPTPTGQLNDFMRSGNALAKVVYRVGSRDSLDFTFAYRQVSQGVPIDASLQPLIAAPINAQRGSDGYGNDPTRFVPLDARPTQDSRDIFASLAYRHHFVRGDLIAALTFRDSLAQLSCDPTRALGELADPGTICSDVDHHTRAYGALVHYAVTLGQHQLLKVGLRIDGEQSIVGYSQYTRDDALLDGGPDPAQTISGRDKNGIFNVGAFAEDRIAWKRASILIGLRYDEQVVAVGAGPNVHFEMPSARIGGVYNPHRGVQLHAYVGYLWQTPSLDGPTAARALGLVPANQPVPYDLKAERTLTGEIGITLQPLSWLRGDLTGWGRWSIHPIDDQEVGNTDLKAEYNYYRGRGYGLEVALHVQLARRLAMFGNASLQQAAGQGFASAKYLFTPDQLAYAGWQIFDHQQVATANVGIDVQSLDDRSHIDAVLQYGSGLRTGETNEYALPPHVVVSLSARHRFIGYTSPEIALDVLNVTDNHYAYRIGNASVIGSAYAAGRTLSGRVVLHF